MALRYQRAVVALAMLAFACAARAQIDIDQLRAKFKLQDGPHQARLLDQASITVPSGYAVMGADDTRELLRAMGNSPSNTTIGLIAPASGKLDWFAVLSYHNAGYIKDDDARDWNADELIKNIREGTEESNKRRKEMGVTEMEIIGWAEKPRYDQQSRKVVWAIASRDKGSNQGPAEQGVNFNTLALGREGYVSMNLVTDLAALPKDKRHAEVLLDGLAFNEGKRYADFNASTDKVAAYGLTALVAGGAAAKLGLFGKLLALLLAAKKLVIFAVIGAGALLFKLFVGRRKAGQ